MYYAVGCIRRSDLKTIEIFLEIFIQQILYKNINLLRKLVFQKNAV